MYHHIHVYTFFSIPYVNCKCVEPCGKNFNEIDASKEEKMDFDDIRFTCNESESHNLDCGLLRVEKKHWRESFCTRSRKA